MKQLEGPEKLSQDIEVHAPVKQEYKFIGNILIRPGVKLYALNTTTWQLALVISKKEVTASLNGNPVLTQRAIHDPAAVYILAINRKNAERKAAKIIKRYLAEQYIIALKNCSHAENNAT